jgi:tungstate transport system ATP-binding protein
MSKMPSPASAALLPVKTHDLCFDVSGRRIIDHMNLTITGSDITVILGPNGAGKSVLLRLLHGLLEPAKGYINWGDCELNQSVRKRQALVFQRPVMMRRSVGDNISFALSLRDFPDRPQRLKKALELCGLSARAKQPAFKLSGGEQQRLAIARALALDPEVLILDEPSSNLDPGATMAIEQLIMTAREGGKKVILVTHDLGQAKRVGDEIIFMHHGRIIEQSRCSEFFEQPKTRESRAYLAGGLLL